MAITNIAELKAALNSPSKNQTFYITKGQLTYAIGGERMSYWTLGGFPVAGTAPTTPEVCNNSFPAAITFNYPASGNLYVGRLNGSSAMLERLGYVVADRLMHMGGLNANINTLQTVGMSIDQVSSNFVERRGSYSDVEWYLEVYGQAGGTASTLTITYTDTADVGGQTITYAWPATQRIRRLIRILPTGSNEIKSIDSCQFSVITTAVGNFGFTAIRPLTMIGSRWANRPEIANWQQVGLPRVYSDSCLQVIAYTPTASTLTSIAVKLELVNG